MVRNHAISDFADQIRQDEFSGFMSLETIAREKFLIEHGVRHLVICGYIEDEDHKMASMYAMLRRAPSYASHPWNIETFEYVHNNAKAVHHSRLEGLLLGYHPDAIEAQALFPASAVSITRFNPSTTSRSAANISMIPW